MYLHLTDEEYECTKRKHPNIQKAAQDLLEYGESRDGQWNSDKFMKHKERLFRYQRLSFPRMRVIYSTGS
jgi:hypothetical protein